MLNRINVSALAATLILAGSGLADAAEPNAALNTQRSFDVLPVVGAAYHDPRVATTSAEVHRQGGFAVAGATLWPIAASDIGVPGGTFNVPPVVGAAYHSPGVALNAAEVRRQGGLVTAGAVDWRPAAGTAVGLKVEAAALGAR